MCSLTLVSESQGLEDVLIITEIALALIQKQLDKSFYRLHSSACQSDVVVITYSTDKSNCWQPFLIGYVAHIGPPMTQLYGTNKCGHQQGILNFAWHKDFWNLNSELKTTSDVPRCWISERIANSLCFWCRNSSVLFLLQHLQLHSVCHRVKLMNTVPNSKRLAVNSQQYNTSEDGSKT